MTADRAPEVLPPVPEDANWRDRRRARRARKRREEHLFALCVIGSLVWSVYCWVQCLRTPSRGVVLQDPHSIFDLFLVLLAVNAGMLFAMLVLFPNVRVGRRLAAAAAPLVNIVLLLAMSDWF